MAFKAVTKTGQNRCYVDPHLLFNMCLLVCWQLWLQEQRCHGDCQFKGSHHDGKRFPKPKRVKGILFVVFEAGKKSVSTKTMFIPGSVNTFHWSIEIFTAGSWCVDPWNTPDWEMIQTVNKTMKNKQKKEERQEQNTARLSSEVVPDLRKLYSNSL